jgi:hypothetical protein
VNGPSVSFRLIEGFFLAWLAWRGFLCVRFQPAHACTVGSLFPHDIMAFFLKFGYPVP